MNFFALCALLWTYGTASGSPKSFTSTGVKPISCIWNAEKCIWEVDTSAMLNTASCNSPTAECVSQLSPEAGYYSDNSVPRLAGQSLPGSSHYSNSYFFDSSGGSSSQVSGFSPVVSNQVPAIANQMPVNFNQVPQANRVSDGNSNEPYYHANQQLYNPNELFYNDNEPYYSTNQQLHNSADQLFGGNQFLGDDLNLFFQNQLFPIPGSLTSYKNQVDLAGSIFPTFENDVDPSNVNGKFLPNFDQFDGKSFVPFQELSPPMPMSEILPNLQDSQLNFDQILSPVSPVKKRKSGQFSGSEEMLPVPMMRNDELDDQVTIKLEAETESFKVHPSMGQGSLKKRMKKRIEKTEEQIDQMTNDPNSSKKKIFSCTFEDCPKTFHRSYNLKSHILCHYPERAFACKFNGCESSFKRHHDLLRHTRTIHKDVYFRKS